MSNCVQGNYIQNIATIRNHFYSLKQNKIDLFILLDRFFNHELQRYYWCHWCRINTDCLLS
jgi:hypothetical protein